MKLFEVFGFYPYNLTITHNHQFPVLFFCFFNQAFTGKQNPCINLFLHLFDFNLAHGL